jgi:hypothetical protein
MSCVLTYVCRGPTVAALVHAALLKKEQDAIWGAHTVDAEEEGADENTPLTRNG